MRTHPLSAIAFAILWVGGSLSAQQNLVTEGFDYTQTGVFPPSGWQVLDAGTAPDTWNDATVALTGTLMHNLHSDAAAHEFSSPAVQCDSWLVAPAVDLTGVSAANVRFVSEFDWVSYMAHSTPSLGNGVSTLEVSVDGGSTWSTVWTATPTATSVFSLESHDLASWVGQGSVTLTWHYSGEYAHAWAVDDVYIGPNGATSTPSLSVTGTCPGPGALIGNGMTPNGPVRLYFTLVTGSWTVPAGSCAGVVIPGASPTLLPVGGTVFADSVGSFTIPGNMLPYHCGAFLGAVDVATCTPTPLVVL